jgi:hypothetical protein
MMKSWGTEEMAMASKERGRQGVAVAGVAAVCPSDPGASTEQYKSIKLEVAWVKVFLKCQA